MQPAVPALITALKDKDTEVGFGAAEALGKMGAAAQPAVPALITATKDKDEIVKREAVETLSKLNNKP
jgi:HEAT repeat protein